MKPTKSFMTKKQLEKVIKEMCERVKADYSKIDTSKKDWYLKYSWTEDEQYAFKEWLVKYFHKNNVWNNKMIADREACYFVLNFGWKIKK